jgi:micrococcal nuclease
MRRSPWVVLLLLVLAAAGAAARRSGGTDADGARADPGAARVGRVLRVVDGDTIKVGLDGGGTERVRYIGMDTPESVKPGTPVQCYAKAASHENERLVGGQRVRLVPDVEQRDRYGRLLAYVYRVRDGRFVNAELVRGGYAVTLTIPPNVRHADDFRRLAATARRERRGLWRVCQDG